MKSYILVLCLLLLASCSGGESPHTGDEPEEPKEIVKTYNNLDGLVRDCADPYVLKHDGIYYLYGTGGSDGIKVYMSKNLAAWTKAQGVRNGYALYKDDVWGENSFWAPEVYYINGKFYMYYTSETKIAVAESSSPLGPFVQSAEHQNPFHPNINEIDTHLFIDDDGTKYLYFVRTNNGNIIWGAELNDDLRSIKENTLTRCITAGSQAWETKQGKIAEGPFMLKHKGIYYLTYSANHYQNPYYGVGYATSNSPLGPWEKYEGNPVLVGNDLIQGLGHHSFVTVSETCKYIVYHSHYDVGIIAPRKLGIDLYDFIPATDGSPDILKVYGPTTTLQEVCSE